MVPETIRFGGERLQRLRPSDAPAIFAAVDADRAHLGRWLAWVEDSRTPADTARFLESVEAKTQSGETLAFGIWRGAELLGLCGLHDISQANGNAQIGYWLRSAATGAGVMTRAAGQLLALGFQHLNLERIEIRAATENRKSWRVAERLGFQLEGVMRRAIRVPGGYADARLYSLLRGEWLAQPSKSSAP